MPDFWLQARIQDERLKTELRQGRFEDQPKTGGFLYFDFCCQAPARMTFFASFREVLHGVGADGVGVKFPIFAVIAAVCPCPFL